MYRGQLGCVVGALGETPSCNFWRRGKEVSPVVARLANSLVRAGGGELKAEGKGDMRVMP